MILSPIQFRIGKHDVLDGGVLRRLDRYERAAPVIHGRSKTPARGANAPLPLGQVAIHEDGPLGPAGAQSEGDPSAERDTVVAALQPLAVGGSRSRSNRSK